MAKKEDRPWVQLLLSKYCSGADFWEVKARRSHSLVWKNIINCKDVINNGSCYLVGDGGCIDILKHPWIPWNTQEDLRASFNPSLDGSIKLVSDLFLPSTRIWNVDFVKCTFNAQMANQILSITPLLMPRKDSLIWKASNFRIFFN